MALACDTALLASLLVPLFDLKKEERMENSDAILECRHLQLVSKLIFSVTFSSLEGILYVTSGSLCYC
jgi:hypothetical protein